MLLLIKYSINSIKVVKPYYENLIRTWQSTPLFLPEKFHGQRSLAGCSPWCCKELDMTEWLHFLSLWKPLRDWICFANIKQDSRRPCPSLSLRVCSNSCPFSQWCHPTVSSSVTHFSSCSVFPNIMIFSNDLTPHQMAKGLELQLQHQSFKWIFRVHFL